MILLDEQKASLREWPPFPTLSASKQNLPVAKSYKTPSRSLRTQGCFSARDSGSLQSPPGAWRSSPSLPGSFPAAAGNPGCPAALTRNAAPGCLQPTSILSHSIPPLSRDTTSTTPLPILSRDCLIQGRSYIRHSDAEDSLPSW